MVLLNYRLGDRAVMSPHPCPCGRTLPVLERLEGRRSETIRLGDGRRLSSFLIENIFKWELRNAFKVQFAQSTPEELTLRIVLRQDADTEELHRELAHEWREQLGDSTRLSVEFVDDIPRNRQGKFRKVVPAPTGVAT
jgi:phenylacetate-CoA ligase